jgi:hypothetical protein
MGCATTQLYEGPKRGAGEIVVIRGMSNLDISAGGLAAKVCEFDERPLKTCEPSIEFLPGEHTLEIQSTYFGIAQETQTVFRDFHPGERFLLGIQQRGAFPDMPALIYDGNVNNKPSTK